MKGKILIIFCLNFFSLGALSQTVKISKIIIRPQSITNEKIKDIKPVGNSLTLPYERNCIFLYFSFPKNVSVFAYKLKGITPEEISTNNSYAFFNNLPPGEYDFSVRNITEKRASHLKIYIQSPIWLRWWFLPTMFLYGIIAIGICFYMLYRYRLRKLLHLQIVRENIARDLHDDMGSYLSSISILSQGVTNIFYNNPQQALALIRKIGDTARQVIDSTSEIIWSVNPENDSMQQNVIRLRDISYDLIREQEIIFNFEISESEFRLILPLEKRRDFFSIYKEALNNIAKYAMATHVWIDLIYSNSALILRIKDDGAGFHQQISPQTGLRGNGLRNMSARAKKINGSLNITTAPGQGTTIELRIF